LKGIGYASSVALLVIVSCGGGPAEPVSALAVMPEDPLVAMAVSDPVAVVSNIDGYIAEGIPMLGDNFLGTALSAAAGVDDLETLMTDWGLDPHGTTVFFMEAMTPATIGLASGATDPGLFVTSLEAQGVTFTDSDPIEGVDVKSAAIPSGNLFVAGDRGLLLVAGSRSTLTSMLGRLDPGNGASPVELGPATFYFCMQLGSIGPMAAAQIEMVRPQVLSEMAQNGGPGNEMAIRMIDLYFDAISLFLTQTQSVESRVVIGPEEIECESVIDFVPGSDLAAVLTAPVEINDLTDHVPDGDIIMARASLPPELTIAVVNAVTGAMGLEYPSDALETYAEWSKNTAVSVLADDAGTMLHVVAVYALPEGVGLEQVRDIYQSQIDFTRAMMAGMGGMMDMTLGDQVYMDRDFMVFDMTMNTGAIMAGNPEIPEGAIPEMDYTVWMTVADGLLWLEMADQPEVVTQLIEGTWTGGLASDAPVFEGTGHAQMVASFNLDGYLRMIAGFMGGQIDLSALPVNPVWINGWVESMPEDSRLVEHCSLSGMDLARMIGNYMPLFAGEM
jgi:hypothetical protein